MTDRPIVEYEIECGKCGHLDYDHEEPCHPLLCRHCRRQLDPLEDVTALHEEEPHEREERIASDEGDREYHSSVEERMAKGRLA